MSLKPTKQKPPIDDFNGYYQFMNNDYPSWIQFQGITFPNITTAFQAARTPSMQLRQKISQLQNYQEFKSIVSEIKNPQNWSQNRYKVMEKLVRDKFKRNKEIANKLAATQERKLYNCYVKAGDNQLYWGCVKQPAQKGITEYKGANNLGKILESVRADIIKLTDTQKWLMCQQLQQDCELYPQVSLTVMKQSQAIDKLLLQNRNYFMFGSHPKVHFKLQHPSISKFHAAIYFSELEVIIVDMNSTHGTFIIKNGQTEKTKLQPLQKRSLQNGDIIYFGLSSRTYLCNISFEKVQAAIKRKKQQIEKNVTLLKEVNAITSSMTTDQIKSKIGYKKYQGLHVQNINKNFSYNDIKEIFQQYGQIEKIRMVQNYRDGKFQGEVVVIYADKVKMEDVLKQIKQKDDKIIQKMQLKPVDKYDIQKILAKGREERQRREKDSKDRERKRSRSRDNDRRRSRSKDKERERQRDREKERRQKHKKYDKYDRDDRKRQT